MNIKQFFTEDNGTFSSTRLVSITWGLGTFVTWAGFSIAHNVIEAIPESVVTVIGIVLAGKVIQKFGETKNDSSNG